MDEDREPLSPASQQNAGMLIEVEGERFEITKRTDNVGNCAYDFTWLNGPGESSYGFTIGPAQSEFPRILLEKEATMFVRGFFSDDGIGTQDFSEFVKSRRGTKPERR